MGFKTLLVTLGLAGLIAGPIAFTETVCSHSGPREPITHQSLLAPEERRTFNDTFTTYPEWSVVHAYEDLAVVARAQGEAAFGYGINIKSFWRSLCSLNREATARGPVGADMKATLYIVGWSFTGEMAVKGFWENTFGWLTTWLRGPTPTAEDRFAHDVNDDYARFLRQTPWYDYPFFGTLARFWRETPFTSASPARAVERRVAMTLEYGVKGLYAAPIRWLAGLSPATLTLRAVTSPVDPSELAPGGGTRVVRELPDGRQVIETQRYRAFTAFLIRHLQRGGSVTEIAGHDQIFVTIVADERFGGLPGFGGVIVTAPIYARPGFERRGYLVPVARLGEFVARVGQIQATFEHAYDF